MATADGSPPHDSPEQGVKKAGMAFPFIDHVGVRIEEIGQGTSRLTLRVQPFHNNSQGVVHGGALFTLADTGMGAALYAVPGPQERGSTLEIKINYFKPVRAGTVECRSQVVHRGRTVANLESSLFVDGVLMAKANGSFAIFEPKAKSGTD